MAAFEESGPTLRGERVLLRPAREDDVQAIAEILAEPEVARWWGHNDVAEVRDEMRESTAFAIVVHGAVAGWLLCEEDTHPDSRSVGLDISLTTALHGHGYAPEALRLVIRHFIERGHHRFTIDPAVDNERAIRAYNAVGFKPVGVMRAYERGSDGTWHDNLLMDLLAAELDG